MESGTMSYIEYSQEKDRVPGTQMAFRIPPSHSPLTGGCQEATDLPDMDCFNQRTLFFALLAGLLLSAESDPPNPLPKGVWLSPKISAHFTLRKEPCFL